ncbi:MAG: signal recognition particle-docking protein FtsY [Chitinivorax sp.]
MQPPKQPENPGQETQDNNDKGSWKDKFKTGFAKAFGREPDAGKTDVAPAPTADSSATPIAAVPPAADNRSWKEKFNQSAAFGTSPTQQTASATEAPAAAAASPQSHETGTADGEPQKANWKDKLKQTLTFNKDDTPATAQPPLAGEQPAAPKANWKERLRAGLSKTRSQLGTGVKILFRGRKIDEELYEELETVLLTADVGVEATTQLLEEIRTTVKRRNLDNAEELKTALQQSLTTLIQPLQQPLDISQHKPFIIMLAGVNGAGKTTSIGKLAKYFQSQGKSVLLAAGDTFRAAAREQLLAWGERNNVTVISQESGDSAAVIFDAINAARARGIDVVLADTAGRLPTQLHLMEEIKKVKRVIQKADPTGPHEVLVVLDANTGQNAVTQVKAFDDALGVTGLIVSKLDGTAKGGVIAAIAKQRPIPLRFIGVGEQLDDLRPFVAADYVEALFD